MFIYIYGSDSYRIREKIKEYKDDFRRRFENNLTAEKFDLKDKGEMENLKNFLAVSDMFSDYKLTLVENFSLGEKDGLNDFFKKEKIFDSEKNIILAFDIFDSSAKKPGAFFKKAKYIHEINGFKNFFQAKDWLEKKVGENKLKITAGALKMIFESFGADSWKMIGEIEKLSFYKPEQKITEKDIFDVCSLKTEVYVFSIFDAFFGKNRKKALYLFTQAVKSGLEEQMVFNLLVDQIRTAAYLVLGKEKYLEKANPFKLKKIREKLGNFSKEKILVLFEALADIDDGIKSGRWDCQTALERFLMI